MSFELANQDKLRLSVLGVYEGQTVNNVFFMRIAPNATPTTFPVEDGSFALLDEFQTLWRANVLPLLSTGYSTLFYVLDKVEFPPIAPFTSWNLSNTDVIGGAGAPDSGSGGASSMPSYVGVNVQLKTGLHGRSRKGRKSFGPIPKSAVDTADSKGNLLTAAAWNSWGLAAIAVCETISVGAGATGFLARAVVGSKKRYLAMNEFWEVDIESVPVSQTLGSQVSRKQKNTGM